MSKNACGDYGGPLWTRLNVAHEATEVFGLVERGLLTVIQGRALVSITVKQAAEIRKLFDRHEAREAIGTRRAILAEFDRLVAEKGRAKMR